MRLEALNEQIKGRALVVAVSKGRSPKQIMELYERGCRDFGENRVAEALEKMEQLPQEIQWHFIGKLQRSKVSKIIGRFALIHSVDSLELAEKIAESSSVAGKVTSILLQVNTSEEASKSGFSVEECKALFSTLDQLEGIKIQGLMTIAPLTEERERIIRCFQDLRKLQGELQRRLPLMSMGMSQDYDIALEEGANLLRIGSALFDES